MSDLSEIKKLVEDQGRAWEEFKATNDQLLKDKAEGKAVGDLEAKLATINTRLAEIADEAKQANIKANRPGNGGDKSLEVELKRFNDSLSTHAARLSRPAPAQYTAEQYGEYKAAFSKMLRKGKEELTEVERKALNAGTDPQGGYLMAEEMDAMIDRVAVKASALRSVARVVTIGGGMFEKLVKTGGASAGGWGTETTAPSETDTQSWAKLEFTPGTVWAEPRATSTALEDSVINLEQDLADEIGITFADQESQAYIDGSGVNRPKGFLSYTMVENASYAWGSVGHVVSGGASGFASSNPSDALVSLQHALKRSYRSNAVFMMNDATLGTVRRFKDGQGIYLWAPSGLQGGVVGQLLGHSVLTDDYMPDLGSNTYPIAFADFQRGYVIVDRRGTTILRDPYTAKPYVKFYATRRVGGGITNFEAIKLMKCST